MRNQAWVGSNEKSKNPFEQGNDNIYPLKDLLRDHEEQLGKLRIEYLIVLTNKNVELDWKKSDVSPGLRVHVSLIGDVKEKILQFAAHKTPLNAHLARQALEALRPAKLPDDLFAHDDWNTPSKIVSPLIDRTARSEVRIAKRSVPKGKVIAGTVDAAPAKRARSHSARSKSKRPAKRPTAKVKKISVPVAEVSAGGPHRTKPVSSSSAQLGGGMPPLGWILGIGAVAFVVFALITGANRPSPSPIPRTISVTAPRTPPPAPTPTPSAYFTFTVCNQSHVAATIAVMSRQSPQSNDWVVQGWAQTLPGRCGVVGRYVKGDFFAAGTGPTGQRWGARDLALCVTAQQFRRINTTNYRCGPPEGLLYFKKFRIFDDQFTWPIGDG